VIVARLIDADAVKDSFCGVCSIKKRYGKSSEMCRDYKDLLGNGCSMMRLIDETPTADVVEVKHGRWISHEGYEECDLCHTKSVYAHNYCPNCGAKMDGDTE
jgi:hypothetical protein